MLTGQEPRHLNAAHYEGLLARCEERDAIQATRPEGCTCLGTGRRDCPCPEGMAEKARARAEKDRKVALHQQVIREQRWRDAGIPRRFESFRLDNTPVRETHPELIAALTYPSLADVDDTAEANAAWEQRYEQWESSWFLWAPHGRGKTGLAVAYAWETLQCVQDGYLNSPTILFRTVPGLLSELRATMDPASELTEESLMKRCRDAHLLILDDLGAERVSGWVEERLYLIIGQRHDEMLPTVFTSNLSLEAVGNKLGERITWRIAEMCGPDNIVQVQGPNLRDPHG